MLLHLSSLIHPGPGDKIGATQSAEAKKEGKTKSDDLEFSELLGVLTLAPAATAPASKHKRVLAKSNPDALVNKSANAKAETWTESKSANSQAAIATADPSPGAWMPARAAKVACAPKQAPAGKASPPKYATARLPAIALVPSATSTLASQPEAPAASPADTPRAEQFHLTKQANALTPSLVSLAQLDDAAIFTGPNGVHRPHGQTEIASTVPTFATVSSDLASRALAQNLKHTLPNTSPRVNRGTMDSMLMVHAPPRLGASRALKPKVGVEFLCDPPSVSHRHAAALNHPSVALNHCLHATPMLARIQMQSPTHELETQACAPTETELGLDLDLRSIGSDSDPGSGYSSLTRASGSTQAPLPNHRAFDKLLSMMAQEVREGSAKELHWSDPTFGDLHLKVDRSGQDVELSLRVASAGTFEMLKQHQDAVAQELELGSNQLHVEKDQGQSQEQPGRFGERKQPDAKPTQHSGSTSAKVSELATPPRPPTQLLSYNAQLDIIA